MLPECSTTFHTREIRLSIERRAMRSVPRNALLRHGDTHATFWRDGKGWPTAPPGFVFLGAAVHFMGEAMFPNSWDPGDPLATPRNPLDRTLSTRTPNADILRATSLLAMEDEAYKRRAGLASLLSPAPMPSVDEWETAVALADAEDCRVSEAFQRFFRVCYHLQEQFFHERIRTATRANLGGSLVHQPPDFWYIEHFFSRFIKCRVDAANPFRNDLPPDDADWIFVDKGDLDKALLALVRTPSDCELTTDGHVASANFSPYLRVMIKVAQELELSPGNQIKKSAVEETIRKHWPDTDTLGGTALGYMATFLREPESRKGRKPG